MDRSEDKEMIAQAVAGDATAFRRLLDGHYTVIYRMAYRFCGNPTDAEDITQMACLKLAHKIGSFKGDSAFTTWLYMVVVNTARDWLRSEGRHDRGAIEIGVVENIITTSENPEHTLEQKQKMNLVRALPQAEREAIWLVFGEGLSHKDAALALGCAEGTISYRIHEARKKLGQQIADKGRRMFLWMMMI